MPEGDGLQVPPFKHGELSHDVTGAEPVVDVVEGVVLACVADVLGAEGKNDKIAKHGGKHAFYK